MSQITMTLDIPVEEGKDYHVSVVPIVPGTHTYLFCLKEITIDGHLIPKFASFKLDPSGKFYVYSDDKDTTVLSIQKVRDKFFSRFFREEKIEMDLPKGIGDLKNFGHEFIQTSIRYKVDTDDVTSFESHRDNEKLGQAIDRVENMQYALNMNLPAEMHVEQFRKTLPEIIGELKNGFVEATGDNPWE